MAEEYRHSAWECLKLADVLQMELRGSSSLRCWLHAPRWNPVSLMALSMTSREKRRGGSWSTAIAPNPCQGPNRAGSLAPDRSSENARSSELASELKM
jgi:hypothetical protein